MFAVGLVLLYRASIPRHRDGLMRSAALRFAVTLALFGCERAEGDPPRDVVPDADMPAPVTAPAPTITPTVTLQPADEIEVVDGVVATSLELDALRALLDVPVQGVTRAQLRDTYDEARGERVHEALDILAARATPVLSAADGKLLKLFDSKNGGLMVYATDPTSRFILFYGHLDGYAEGLTEGMPLARGQLIGYVGTTGNAPPGTPHLHFGILRGDPRVSWSEGVPVNPYVLLTDR